MEFSTKAIHAGTSPEPITGAIMPPIYMTTTYAQQAPGVHQGYDYTRAGNPNFTILEKTLASLEEARHATVFSSGLGALTALISTLSAGDCVIGVNSLYGGTYRLFDSIFKRFGICFHAISSKELSSTLVLEEILVAKRAKWLFFETPTNPLLEVFDMAALAALARKYGVLSVVDNTFATPYLQNPLTLGVDVVWHSTTKYVGGHSDVVGGVAMTNDDIMKASLDFARKSMGLNPSPFDAWLMTRGVKTLALRMEQHQRNAGQIAQFLAQHPKVAQVYYPGLPHHPTHDIAIRQMRGAGGIISAEFRLPLMQMKRLISAFRLFILAESLGGVESLVCHPVTMTHGAIPEEQRRSIGLSDGLVRFSVGIEASKDLIDDLTVALEAV